MTTRVDICMKQDEKTDRDGKRFGSQDSMVELIIIDEAERLSTAAVEYLRDMFDRTTIGLMFIGMPGIEKRLARYPQLYSRVGFAHHYRPLQGDELTFVLTRHWRTLGLSLDSADFTDTQAIAAISRITNGNFRLLHRLFVQIERILRINELSVITEDVVEAARSTLIIGLVDQHVRSQHVVVLLAIQKRHRAVAYERFTHQTRMVGRTHEESGRLHAFERPGDHRHQVSRFPQRGEIPGVP
jgi:hypothetical protein